MVACLATIAAFLALAQDQKVFRSDTRLVSVDVVVRNSKGPVEGLTATDFQLFDNGKLQRIGAFAVITSNGAGPKASPEASVATSGLTVPGTDLPVTATVLFINNLTIPFNDQVQAKQRIADVMKPLPRREPIAIYVLNFSLRLMTDFTDDPTKISRALEAAWGEQPQPPPIMIIPPVYEALEQIANQLAGRPGRKNLLWFADFFPVARQDRSPAAYFAMLRTLKALNAANVAVYPISADGVAGPTAYSATQTKAPPAWRNASQGRSGVDGMYWAASTGGDSVQNTDVGNATRRALDDSRITYSIGFYPESQDGLYHELKVKVDRKGVDVRSRQGYLAPPPQP